MWIPVGVEAKSMTITDTDTSTGIYSVSPDSNQNLATLQPQKSAHLFLRSLNIFFAVSVPR